MSKRFLIRLLAVYITLILPSGLHASEAVSIGTVLPLSGKFSAFGNKALHGVELAVERYYSTGGGKKRPVRLLIKNSQGMPEAAEEAVAEMEKEGVVAIIGPILGITAESAARKAQKLGVPIITMTQKEGITDIGDQVFRNSLTNRAQVRGIVEYVLKDKKRFAVLYPESPYGKEMNALFAQEVEKRGGKVAASRSYKEGQTDFGQEIKGLGGSKFDALFIPDYPERVGLIIPQLAFYDVKDIALLGTGSWNSQKLIEMAGDYMKNVLFVDGFFAGSRKQGVRDFVDLYAKTYGGEPGLLEALAFDTAGIILSITSKGTESREDIRNDILRIKDYQGVSGNITFGGRDADRGLFFLTVKNGRIEEATP